MALTKVLVPDMTTGNYPFSRVDSMPIDVTEYGAVGDNSTPCDSAVTAAFAAALAQGKPLYFPEGTYKFTTTGTTEWDLTGYEQNGMTIFGSNSGRTILRFPNVTASIGLHIHATRGGLQAFFGPVFWCCNLNWRSTQIPPDQMRPRLKK